MRRCTFLLPGELDTPTGGYRYDRRVVGGLRERGWQVQVLSLPGAYPMPDAAARADAQTAVAALPDGSVVIADGLAFGALADLAGHHSQRLRWVALVHHPLGMETGLGAADAAALDAGERRALAAAGRVVVTSEATARLLASRLDVPPSRITVIEPGCDLPDEASDLRRERSAPPGALTLLCVASVTARKGHLVLIEALAGLRDLPWTLHLVGSLTMDAGTVAAVRQAVAAHGLQARVVWHGATESDALASHYAQADLFVLPSLFEGYGMVLAEALAHGLPVVGTDTGHAAHLLADGAGVLVPPGDAGALRAALAPLLADPARRSQLAEAARAARMRLPSWASACDRWAGLLQTVANGRPREVMKHQQTPAGAGLSSAFSAFSTFSTDWLRLREPHDHRARAAAAASLGEGWMARLPRSAPDDGQATPLLQVMDLGCGTGATLRQLAPQLGGRQHWCVFDHDIALLQAWPEAMAAWSTPSRGRRVRLDGERLHVAGEGFAATVERHAVDLARLPAALDALPFSRTDLLTATALIDLVSAAWLAEVIERAARQRAALAFGLVVDGRVDWDPALEDDARVAAAFGAHQGRDKGFGPALGARAPETARRLLARAGYVIEQARSDWWLQGAAAGDAALLSALIGGMAAAAAEQEPAQATAFERWRRERAALLERTQLRVGHIDLVAWPGRCASSFRRPHAARRTAGASRAQPIRTKAKTATPYAQSGGPRPLPSVEEWR